MKLEYCHHPRLSSVPKVAGEVSARPVSDPYARIGAQLRARREARGLTQRDVAEALGITHSAVSHIEKGAVRGRLDRLQEYARMVDAEVDLVLQIDEDPDGVLLARIGRMLPLLSPELRRTLDAWVDLWEGDYVPASSRRSDGIA